MTTEERWKPVSGHPEIHVSTLGRVKRCGYHIKYDGSEITEYVPEELLPTKMYEGSKFVNFKGGSHLVHILVADTFLDAPELREKYYVEFKDNNKENCSLDNLQYVEMSERVKKLIQEGKRVKPGPYSGVSVKCLQTGEIFGSIGALAEELSLPRSKVTRYINQGKDLLGKTYVRCS